MPASADPAVVRWPCRLIVAVTAVIAPPLHLLACAAIDRRLFELRGGISRHGMWTRYGGITWSWVNLSWIPGGVAMAYGGGGPGTWPSILAIFLMGAGSLAAGVALALALGATLRRGASGGRLRWRLWAWAPLWLGWVPVPIKMTLTYWTAVAY